MKLYIYDCIIHNVANDNVFVLMVFADNLAEAKKLLIEKLTGIKHQISHNDFCEATQDITKLECVYEHRTEDGGLVFEAIEV